MFTGLVEAAAKVRAVGRRAGGALLDVEKPASFGDVVRGESVSVSGVCHTAVPGAEGGLLRFDVSAETHRVGTERAVSRTELAGALRRVALLAGRGRPPKGCLSAADAASLVDCGILGPTPSRNVTGREALRAMEKAARIGREGGTR